MREIQGLGTFTFKCTELGVVLVSRTKNSPPLSTKHYFNYSVLAVIPMFMSNVHYVVIYNIKAIMKNQFAHTILLSQLIPINSASSDLGPRV